MADEDMNDAEVQRMAAEIEGEVSRALGSGQYKAGVKAACSRPPLATKNQAVKDKLAEVVSKCLGGLKESDFGPLLGELNEDQIDMLAKYLHRAMASGTYPHLLKLHAELHKAHGDGPIVRALAERRGV
mmetsp:Transcript_1139/g.3510  ORF Transcript_1139/g.3510 Transcript_1139/m.3510 type:complete len:129 (-) Transcript_1139:54-440(-)